MTLMFAADGLITLLVMFVVFMLLMTLMQRPLKKQAQKAQAMRDSLSEGDRVVLTSGIFATVTHLGDEQAIVELAPGVEVTIKKQGIVQAVAAEDEEFVFDDDPTPSDESTTAGPAAEAADDVVASTPQDIPEPTTDRPGTI